MNSRRKGAKNERVIAKVLKAWTKKEFAKTPASGGLQWKSAMSKGDVVCTTEGHYFPFCIEGKFHVKIDFSHLLTPGIKNVDILDFWRQCERDAKACKKVPMLLMRYNGLPKEFWFLVLDTNFLHRVRQEDMLTFRSCIDREMNYWDKQRNIKLTILLSTEFFKLPYKAVKLIARAYAKEQNKEKRKG